MIRNYFGKMECPICAKCLSHMTVAGRESHVNRCIDSSQMDKCHDLAMNTPSSGTSGDTSSDQTDLMNGTSRATTEPEKDTLDTENVGLTDVKESSGSREHNGENSQSNSQNSIFERLRTEVNHEGLKCPFCDKDGPQSIVHFKRCAATNAPRLSPQDLLSKWEEHKTLSKYFGKDKPNPDGQQQVQKAKNKHPKKQKDQKKITQFFSQHDLELAQTLSLSLAAYEGVETTNTTILPSQRSRRFPLTGLSWEEKKVVLDSRITDEIMKSTSARNSAICSQTSPKSSLPESWIIASLCIDDVSRIGDKTNLYTASGFESYSKTI